ncbi:acyl-CoA dehydrogenase [Mycolicibacterium fluoranthenivorans]|uniref:Alkylation response protein AidB-like acyl-CoA dehydrogenase n=1 Tax=Mycolicibacterium fluoranthenivorans TaxID=258505 RepID=A0A7X5U3X0_9MYCO|nr:acyl-CoA dehydrogenase [Mycolicibacterium fluoranthenivorans]MCV7356128.1 acyl-CoA dehydrogenase [Mycolicibacterium fluoranthenivorans]NIH97955.1 alkylation response protein AidB-like acyl-CoA dehydrogenase [Mycolicibacterium fluoranthenivorans]
MSVKAPKNDTSDRFAARELVRSWAAGSNSITAVRDVELGDPDAWRAPYDGFAQLGAFGVAVPEEHGGAGSTIEDLLGMIDEAAAALVPGPVATTALATLVVDDPEVLEALAAGERSAGLALESDITLSAGTASGSAKWVLGADPSGVLVLPARGQERSDSGDDTGGEWILVDAAADGVTIEDLEATDFSRPLARVTLTSVPAQVLSAPARRVEDLVATVLAAEAAGTARWLLNTATEYAKVREQFGKPIGSFQAVKHMCAEMLLRSQQVAVAADDAAAAASDGSDPEQLSIAAAVAAAVGIDAAKENARDCIQVLGGIGITWEHDAHLYLRRAYSLSQFLGGRSRWLRRIAELTRAGVRRQLHVDVAEAEAVRAEIAAAAADIAALPEEQRQRALAESGLLAPHWPKPYGRNATPAEQLVIDQELAAAHVARPDISIGWWAAPTILSAGTPEQIEKFIPGTLTGDIYWCQLFSEPGAGSDLAALRTKAVRTEGGWLLTGQKVWTSNAHRSNWGICLARTNPDVPKHKGITYFLVEMDAPGIDIRPLREITGDALFNEVFFDDLFVPDEQVIGEVDGGWPLARTTLANERVAIATGGALDKGMEHLLDVLDGRELDGAEADRLGTLIVAAQVGSLLDQLIARLAVGGHDPGAPSSVRKLIGVRYRQGLSEAVMDCLDGAGIVDSADVRYFLNTRCLSIAGGTEQILLTLAGERLLGLPR